MTLSSHTGNLNVVMPTNLPDPSYYRAYVRDYCGAGQAAPFRVVDGRGAPRRVFGEAGEVVAVGADWLARERILRAYLVPEERRDEA